jgi:hypothetical protein
MGLKGWWFMNVALEFGKPKICCTTIVYKVEAWVWNCSTEFNWIPFERLWILIFGTYKLWLMKLPHNLLFSSMLIIDYSIFKVAKNFSFSKLIMSFSCLWNLLLHNGLRFTNTIISLNLKFRLLAFKLEKLQSTMWLWLFWKCQRTFNFVQSSLSATLFKNQQPVHHLHSLHHLLP